MAVMPGVRWEPVTGHSGPAMESYTGIVLHCNAAESYDLRGFFQASVDPDQVSSHFQVARDGTIWQYIDTSTQAWCQGLGNADYLSIESEGLATESATAQQVASIARILRWVHETHGIRYLLAERPGDFGFGWHGMGAAAGVDWGHSECPGVRKNQRAAMLAAANPPAPPVPVEELLMKDVIVKVGDGAAAGQYWVREATSGVYMACWTGSPGDTGMFVQAGFLDTSEAHPISGGLHAQLIAASPNKGVGSLGREGTS